MCALWHIPIPMGCDVMPYRDQDTINALATLPVWVLEAMRDIATMTDIDPKHRCTVFHGAFKNALQRKTEDSE